MTCNRNGARLQASQPIVATIARLIVLAEADAGVHRGLGLGMSVVLMAIYVPTLSP